MRTPNKCTHTDGKHCAASLCGVLVGALSGSKTRKRVYLESI